MRLRSNNDGRQRQYTMSRWGAHKLYPSGSVPDAFGWISVFGAIIPPLVAHCAGHPFCASLSVIRPSCGCRKPVLLNPGPWVADRGMSLRPRAASRRISPRSIPKRPMCWASCTTSGDVWASPVCGHGLDGYRFLAAARCEDAGPVCLTLAFRIGMSGKCFGDWTCTPEEMAFIEDYLAHVEYDELPPIDPAL